MAVGLMVETIYRTLLAFVIAPSTEYHAIAEVGAFVFSRTPTRPAKELLQKAVEEAYNQVAEERNWGFAPGGKTHAENSVKVDEDERPLGVPFDVVQRYIFWYDKQGRIKGGYRDRADARMRTKYDEHWFG